jgi:hypothetical protein
VRAGASEWIKAMAAEQVLEAAANAQAVKPADFVAPTVVSDSSDEEEFSTVKVHHQDTVDYILSWTYAEKNPFTNPFEDDDDDDGFITAEDREAFAYLAASTEVLIRFQQKVREEYEATGYVRVPDDYEERVARLQAASDAAFLRKESVRDA